MGQFIDDDDVTPVMTEADFISAEECFRAVTEDPMVRMDVRRNFLLAICDEICDEPMDTWYPVFVERFSAYLKMDMGDVTLTELRSVFGHIFNSIKKTLDK
jgi:hypothetical protein